MRRDEDQRDAWCARIANGRERTTGAELQSRRAEQSPLDAAGIDFYQGNSHVLGPQGEFIAETGTDPTILLAEVDMQRSEHVRRIWPFLRDRRIDHMAI